MALDQYTKRQKIMLTIVTILGASLFMVTGTMMAVIGSCDEQSQGPGPTAGTFDGRSIDRASFQTLRQVIEEASRGMIPGPVVSVFPDENLKDRLVHYRAPEGAVGFPLFALWPRQHDQDIWLFMAAVEKAKKAGFKPLPREAIRDWYFKVTNQENINPEEYFSNRRIDARAFLDALGSLMVLNEYVESLNNQDQVSEQELVELFRFHNTEQKAKIWSLNSKDFEAEATQLYDQKQKENQLATISSALSGAGSFDPVVGPIENILHAPSFDQSQYLTRKRSVAFDAIVADYEEIGLNLNFSSDELYAFYTNVRGEVFLVEEEAWTQEALEKRIKDVYETEYDRRGGQVPAGYTDWEEWKKQTKEELKVFRHYREVETRVDKLLRLFRSNQLAQIRSEDTFKDLEELRENKRKELDAQRSTLNQWKRIPQVQLDYYKNLEGKLDDLLSTITTQSDKLLREFALVNTADERLAPLFENLQRAFTNTNIGSSLASKVLALQNFVQLEKLEQEVEEAATALEDLENSTDDTEEEISDTLQSLLDAEEIKQAQYDLEAARAHYALAQNLKTIIDEGSKQMITLLARLEARIGSISQESTQTGFKIYKSLLEELAFTFKQEVHNVTKNFIDKGHKRSLQAEVDSRQALIERNAKKRDEIINDQSSIAFNELASAYGLTYQRSSENDQLQTLDELAVNKDWHWVSQVAKAKSFLSGHQPGKVSEVIERPGHGFYILRIRKVQNEVHYAPQEKLNLSRESAIRAISRELAKQELERFRHEALNTNTPEAFLDQLVEKGQLESKISDFFAWNAPVSALQIAPAPDRTSAFGLNDSSLYKSFFNALKEITPQKPLSAIFLEGNYLPDNPGESPYAYSIAMLQGKRYNQERLPADESDLRPYQRDILNLLRARNEELRILLDPAQLLADHEVSYFPNDYKPREEK